MANRIPDRFIQDLLARIDILEIIGERVSLRKAGKEHVACCPFHNEKTPSFTVSQQKQFYHCFGCGQNGDAIQFVIEHDKLSFTEAVNLLAAKIGVQVPSDARHDQKLDHAPVYAMLEQACSWFEAQLRDHAQSAQAIKYLKLRGITGSLAKQFRLGYAPRGWDNMAKFLAQHTDARSSHLARQAGLVKARESGQGSYARFRDRVMFPIRDKRGRVRGFGARVISNDATPKYLNSPEGPAFCKGELLYGLFEACQQVRSFSYLLVVEGYMDVLALHGAGIPQCVATLGTACTAAHLETLFRLTSEIIFCFDGDAAGQRASWKVVELCLPMMQDGRVVKILTMGSGTDPDTMVRRQGKEAFMEQVNQAVSLSDYLFEQLLVHYDCQHIDGRVGFAHEMRGYLRRLPSGLLQRALLDKVAQITGLDPRLLLQDPEKGLTLAAGATFQGKSVAPPAPALASPAQRALALVWARRELIDSIPAIEHFAALQMIGAQLFVAVATQLSQAPARTDREIRAHLAAGLQKQFMPQQLRTIAASVPDAGANDELQDALSRMTRAYDIQQTEKLLAVSSQRPLSPQEKQTLQQLLSDIDRQ